MNITDLSILYVGNLEKSAVYQIDRSIIAILLLALHLLLPPLPLLPLSLLPLLLLHHPHLPLCPLLMEKSPRLALKVRTCSSGCNVIVASSGNDVLLFFHVKQSAVFTRDSLFKLTHIL